MQQPVGVGARGVGARGWGGGGARFGGIHGVNVAVDQNH